MGLSIRRLIPRGAAIAVVLSLGFGPWLSGAPQDDDQVGYVDQVSVSYVLIPIVVRARSGFATKLKEDDFELFVDGDPISPESFESGTTAPFSLVFVQDLSGSMGVAPRLDLSRGVIRTVLAKRKQGDLFSLASFSDRGVAVDTDPTADMTVLEETITGWTGWGKTALHDAVAWLPEILPGNASSRRAVVLITDGADNASELTPHLARDKVKEANLPVYVIGLGTGSPYELQRNGEKMHQHADVLNLIASMTGARYYPVSQPEELEMACQEIVDELRHQYVLGFSTADDGPVRYRELRIEVPGRKVEVSHRQGYEGRAPKAIG